MVNACSPLHGRPPRVLPDRSCFLFGCGLPRPAKWNEEAPSANPTFTVEGGAKRNPRSIVPVHTKRYSVRMPPGRRTGHSA